MGSDEPPFYDTTAYLLEKKRSAEVRAAEATTDEERQAFLRIAEVWGRIAEKRAEEERKKSNPSTGYASRAQFNQQ